jgi:hypothetical protein
MTETHTIATHPTELVSLEQGLSSPHNIVGFATPTSALLSQHGQRFVNVESHTHCGLLFRRQDGESLVSGSHLSVKPGLGWVWVSLVKETHHHRRGVQ